MNEPKNFDDFKKKQLDNERTFDLHTEMLKELSTTLDTHTIILTSLQTDVASIKNTMATKVDISNVETRLNSINSTQEQILKLLQQKKGE
jgi:hypothetical protein